MTISRGEATHFSSTSIRGKTYQDVVVARCTACLHLQEFTFGKTAGIISYQADNVEWTRL